MDSGNEEHYTVLFMLLTSVLALKLDIVLFLLFLKQRSHSEDPSILTSSC